MKTTRKIWIDLDNSPHVLIFRPVIQELERRGYDVLITAKNSFQTCELAEMFKIPYRKVGRHYGKNPLLKFFGVVFRAIQLAPIIIREKPTIALSHGSRSQLLLAFLMRITSIVMIDYEHVRGLTNLHPTWILTPEAIPKSSFGNSTGNILHYPGIKEDIYIPSFVPDDTIINTLDLDPGKKIITIRPPATEAHYHDTRSEELLESVIDYLSTRTDIKMVALPRTDKQASDLRARWPDLFRTGAMIIPDTVVDGLNLSWNSDLIISGGGTMNREAAALGVPVYSIFMGAIGSVDKYLAETGRLVMLTLNDKIQDKIIIKKSYRSTNSPSENGVFSCVMDKITDIADHPRSQVHTKDLGNL